MSDSYYSKCTITQMNVSGYATFLVVSPITVKSEMQDIAIISVTEAESVAKVHWTLDLLYIKCVLEYM